MSFFILVKFNSTGIYKYGANPEKGSKRAKKWPKHYKKKSPNRLSGLFQRLKNRSGLGA
jgi:hypothetical protein